MISDENDEWHWLKSTRYLQETTYGVDYTTLSGEKLADYLLMNAFALADELHESMGEAQWKPWAKNRGELNRDAFAGEIVDLLHFAGNMLVAAGITDEELVELYRGKQQRNVARQKHGYDAVASKCPGCRRELDKPGVMVLVNTKQNAFLTVKCSYCDTTLGTVIHNTINWQAGVNVPGITPVMLLISEQAGE